MTLFLFTAQGGVADTEAGHEPLPLREFADAIVERPSDFLRATTAMERWPVGSGNTKEFPPMWYQPRNPVLRPLQVVVNWFQRRHWLSPKRSASPTESHEMLRQALNDPETALLLRRALTGPVLPFAAGTCGSRNDGAIPKFCDAPNAPNTLDDSVITQNSGNIGIGTATPQYKLNVASSVGNGAQSYIRVTDTTADVTGGLYGGVNATLVIGAQRAGFSDGAAGILDVTTNHPLFLKTNDQTRMTILGGGNVGIGTAAPAYKLAVASAVGNGSQSYIRINDTTADVTGGFYGGADATLIFGAQRTGFSEGAGGILDVTTNNPLFLKTNDQTRMTILGGGNVGIATSAPTQKLTVVGTIESTSGGFKFPDGTTQTTAGGGGGGISGSGTLNFVPKFTPNGTTLGDARITDNATDIIRVDAGLGNFRILGNPTSPNIVGGHSTNNVLAGVVGATISGGGAPVIGL